MRNDTSQGGATPLPVGTWNVDAVHSQVGFAVEYVAGTFRGSFSPVDAKLVVTDALMARGAAARAARLAREHTQSNDQEDLIP